MKKREKNDEFYLLLRTIWHEFGHAILGLKHLCQNKHIMSVTPIANYHQEKYVPKKHQVEVT
ncbi:MAG: hypothetical protein OXC03_08200 [Flavobacteriaceae bacterium]|nr:hypothetical protein [Flavobacteriaceae bacterium]